MELKNGTHISAGRNCCAKTVYTGEVIHVIYNADREFGTAQPRQRK